MTYITALNSFEFAAGTVFPTLSKNLIDDIGQSTSFTTLYEKRQIHNLSIKSLNALKKIDAFLGLTDNWDSYGAIKPSEKSINQAKDFIKKADADRLQVYFTAPGRSGDVLVEYRLTDEISAEVYFNPDGSSEVLIFKGSDCIAEGNIEDNYGKLFRYAGF